MDEKHLRVAIYYTVGESEEAAKHEASMRTEKPLAKKTRN